MGSMMYGENERKVPLVWVKSKTGDLRLPRMPVDNRVAKKQDCRRPSEMGKEACIRGGSFWKYDKHEFDGADNVTEGRQRG